MSGLIDTRAFAGRIGESISMVHNYIRYGAFDAKALRDLGADKHKRWMLDADIAIPQLAEWKARRGRPGKQSSDNWKDKKKAAHRIAERRRRFEAASPAAPDDLHDLIASALAAGRVTRCPPTASPWPQQNLAVGRGRGPM